MTRTVLVVVLVLSLGLFTACGSEPEAPEPTPGERTGLDGEVILQEKCVDRCHGIDRIEEQELDAVGWAQVIDDMNARGAGVTDDEAAALAEYLALRQ